MLDRTDFDARFADHARQIERVRDEVWRLETTTDGPRSRPWLAAALIALAARIGPAAPRQVIERPAGT